MGYRKKNSHQLRLNLEFWQNLAKKPVQTIHSPFCHFPKGCLGVVGFFILVKDILVLKMERAQQGLLLYQKTPLERQKNHLLTSENKLIWHIALILFALTWPELCLAPCWCFHSCGLVQISWMATNTSGSAALGPHLWTSRLWNGCLEHPDLRWVDKLDWFTLIQRHSWSWTSQRCF